MSTNTLPPSGPPEQSPALFHADDCDARAGWHHLTLCFGPTPDHGVSFFPSMSNPPELARRLAWLVRVLKKHPGLIRCAAGNHVAPVAGRPADSRRPPPSSDG